MYDIPCCPTYLADMNDTTSNLQIIVMSGSGTVKRENKGGVIAGTRESVDLHGLHSFSVLYS